MPQILIFSSFIALYKYNIHFSKKKIHNIYMGNSSVSKYKMSSSFENATGIKVHTNNVISKCRILYFPYFQFFILLHNYIHINYFLFTIIFSSEEKYIRGYTFPNPCSVFEYAIYFSSSDEILSNSSKISELEFR